MSKRTTRVSSKAVGHVYGDRDWPAPIPLEGVKSKKRPIFEADGVKVAAGQTSVTAFELQLTLESKVAVVGEAVDVVAALLDEQGKQSAKRHGSLKILHLGPSEELCVAAAETGYSEAVASAVREQRPHIIVLNEARAAGDAAWREAFKELVTGEQLCKYRGAVVVCSAGAINAVNRFCSTQWAVYKDQLQPQPCLHVTEEGSVDKLIEDTSKINYNRLQFWLKSAQDEENNDWKVARFDVGGGPAGPESFRGLIIHHMVESEADFHVRFFFVSQEHRSYGIGGQLVNWVIDNAARLPPSECKTVSLDAKNDQLVAWYEKYGFVDVSGGHTEGDCGITCMERRNVTKPSGIP